MYSLVDFTYVYAHITIIQMNTKDTSSPQKISSLSQATPPPEVNFYPELYFHNWDDHVLVGLSWSHLEKCFNLILIPILLQKKINLGKFSYKQEPWPDFVGSTKVEKKMSLFKNCPSTFFMVYLSLFFLPIYLPPHPLTL